MVEYTSQRDVTLPLLNRIIDESLDQDYRHAALRRTHAADPPSARRFVAVVLACFGLLVGTAAVESAQSADEAVGERSSLVSQIETRRERVADQQQALSELRDESRSLEAELATLARSADESADRLKQLNVPAGFSQVRGPGLRITVADAPDADDARLVRADDLAVLLDGLWNAGAEAIAIDDQRVTTLTSLRNSGPSIGVNQVPLQAPYTIRAIGDPRTLQANLLDSTSGLTWQSLVEQLGFGVNVQTVEELILPAGQLRPLRAAQVDDDTSTGDQEQEQRS